MPRAGVLGVATVQEYEQVILVVKFAGAHSPRTSRDVQPLIGEGHYGLLIATHTGGLLTAARMH